MAVTNQEAEVACAYAVVMLKTEKVEVNVDNVKKVLEASSIEIPPYLYKLFVDATANIDIDEMTKAAICSAPAAGAAPAAAAAGAPAAEEKKEEEAEDSEDEADMGLGLFD